MILTKAEIVKQIANGKIHIAPFQKEQLNRASYDYRLYNELLEVVDDPIDPKHPVQTKQIILNEVEGYVLQPGKLYLGSTVEEIGSDEYVMSLIGKPDIAELGLFLQITADLGHQGAKHRWTLELKVVQPLRIYPNMRIGQVSFWNVEGECGGLYEGKYGSFSTPKASEIYREFL